MTKYVHFSVNQVASYDARYPINKFDCRDARVVLGLRRDVLYVLEYGELAKMRFKVIAWCVVSDVSVASYPTDY